MCSNEIISFKSRISVPYERFRKSIFNLPRPITLNDLSSEMIEDYKYLKKMGFPCPESCNHEECLILRGIFEELEV